VYDAILRRGRDGATIDEIDVALAVDHQSMSPRFSGLEDAGLIVRTKARRPSRSGHACIVWVAREYAPVYDDRPVLTLS
jgi:predicted transcriptional regulator